jgi:hypothetical protein
MAVDGVVEETKPSGKEGWDLVKAIAVIDTQLRLAMTAR